MTRAATRRGAPHLLVIGAGMGGLAAAVTAATQGWRVTLVEKEATPGGKMRRVPAGDTVLDGGPTVFTMKWVFERLFAAAGARLDERVALRQAETIARHAWPDGSRLDLFADPARSRAAIADFAGPAEAARFETFRRDAHKIYVTLRDSYIAAQRPNPLELTRRAGVLDLTAIKPFSTMWQALGDSFRDPRLRQLFGRYATYCGSSPFQAPATLMLVAHVELEGIWLVEGGMHALARATAALAEDLDVEIRYGTAAEEILSERGRASGVRLAGGETLAADAVIFNGDAAALADGRLGPAARRAVPRMGAERRSLSAIVWTGLGTAKGLPLLHHTVCFSQAYRAEFDAVFKRGRLPDEPTVYVCAQDRGDTEAAPEQPERLYFLVNAPARADRQPFTTTEIEACWERTLALLGRCGLEIEMRPETLTATTPDVWNSLFPATGGALYGRASHGWTASFQRPGARSKLPGLYLAGGSVHPGPGVPMAALSGRLAAERLAADYPTAASTSAPRSRLAATFGGIWTA